MKEEIGDQAAIVFAAAFYRALGFGRSVANGFEQGKSALMVMGIPEEDTPSLLARDGVDLSTLVLATNANGAPTGPPVADQPVNAPIPPAPQPPSAAQPPPVSLSLADVVPGEWQVDIQEVGFMIVQRLSMSTTGMFHGEMDNPMGHTVVDGQWQVNPMARQIGFSGQQAIGPNVGPYVIGVQVTYFDQQQIVGVTSANEPVTFHRLGPATF